MKKSFCNFFKYATVFIISFLVGYYVNNNIAFQPNTSNTMVISPIENIKYKFKRKNMDFITLYNNANDTHVDDIYNLVGKKILDKLENNNYRIFITEGDIFEFLNTDNVNIPHNTTGMNLVGLNVILSINKLDVIIHEIGHAIDFDLYDRKLFSKNKSFSNNDIFLEIYNKEKDSLFSESLSYYRDSVEEYFAESFSYYLYRKNSIII